MMAMRCFRPRLITVAIGSLVTALGAALPATAQAPVGCNETIDTRTTELGCWETASQELGSLPSGPLFWYLYNYPTRAAAEGNRDARGTVVQSFGRVWLFSIERGGWRASWKEGGRCRAAQCRPVQRIYGTLHGSGEHPRDAIDDSSARGAGSVVHAFRITMSRDVSRNHRSATETWRRRAGGTADAPEYRWEEQAQSSCSGSAR